MPKIRDYQRAMNFLDTLSDADEYHLLGNDEDEYLGDFSDCSHEELARLIGLAIATSIHFLEGANRLTELMRAERDAL